MVQNLLAAAEFDGLSDPSPSLLFAPILVLVGGIIVVIGMWKVFTKAGQPGWAAIVPFYNLYVLTQIAGRPGWWVILAFLPVVNFVILLLLSIDVAKSFGKDTGFAMGLFFLGFIFYPILGFGDATYLGPAAPLA